MKMIMDNTDAVPVASGVAGGYAGYAPKTQHGATSGERRQTSWISWSGK